MLAAHPQVRPADLELEVLETSALEDLAQVSQVIEACREIGVQFALDDFGTGYSSLTYLKRLPVAQLKIDQSFVRDMLDDPDDLAILEGVIGLATAFRRQVIAEGVETVEHGEHAAATRLRTGAGLRHRPPHAGRRDPRLAGRLAVRSGLASGGRRWPRRFAAALCRRRTPRLGRDLRGLSHRRAGRPAAGAVGVPVRRLAGERRFDRRVGTPPALADIAASHQAGHALAEELLALHHQGRTPAALARLGELHALRDRLLAGLAGLLAERA